MRIGPNEVHIADQHFYKNLYYRKNGDKRPELAYRFGNPESTIAAASHCIHYQRRKSLLECFSGKRVNRFTPMIQSCMDQLCENLQKNFEGKDAIVQVDKMWTAYTADAIYAFGFGKSPKFVKRADFEVEPGIAVRNLVENVNFFTQFPQIGRWVQSLPYWLVAFLPSAVQASSFKMVWIALSELNLSTSSFDPL